MRLEEPAWRDTPAAGDPPLTKKLIVAAVLLLFLAAGCGGIPVNDPHAPLASIFDVDECVPDPTGTTMTDGITILQNQSSGTVIIEHAGFYGAHHLVYVRAVMVPMRYDGVGFSATWPPDRGSISQPGLRWNERVNAIGAKVPPHPNRNGYRNLIIAMRPTAHKGTALGVQIIYRENGQEYDLRTHARLGVIVAKTAYHCGF